jgi:prepilin-type N-terminal cleavage/methylation domain-containing protein
MNQTEKGFTLIELLVTVAITGVIIGGLSTLLYQIFAVPEFGSAKMTAIHELGNTADWFHRDGQMASSASGGSDLTLTLPDSSIITYSLTGTELKRTTASSEITLAQNISNANFSVSNRVITLDITSSPPGSAEISQQATYQVHLRPAEGDS